MFNSRNDYYSNKFISLLTYLQIVTLFIKPSSNKNLHTTVRNGKQRRETFEIPIHQFACARVSEFYLFKRTERSLERTSLLPVPALLSRFYDNRKKNTRFSIK